MNEQEVKQTDPKDEDEKSDDDRDTVLYCPNCESTNITFVRCHAVCLDCNHDW